MKEMTLRQVEVIRALMMTGTITGAAAFLGVSAPGVSRLIRHAEDSLGLRLFERQAGRFVPSVEASAIFDQIGRIHQDVENLSGAIASVRRGKDAALACASAPSIAQFIAARAVRGIRTRFPELFIDLNILKIEETVDYLLLERGEFVVMSSPVEGAGVESEELADGALVAIVPETHPLAERRSLSVHDLAAEPLIGVDPDDPYGRQLFRPFADAGIEPRFALRGRFAQTVVSMVRHGLGVAVIDEFSVAEIYMPGVQRITLQEKASLRVFACRKAGRNLSSYADYAIDRFRRELRGAIVSRPWESSRD